MHAAGKDFHLKSLDFLRKLAFLGHNTNHRRTINMRMSSFNAIHKILGIALLLILLSTGSALAETRPIQLALVTPIQIFPETDSIKGFRFNLIYGKNASLTGLDLGLANVLTGSGAGVQYGFLHLVDGDFTGWQNGWVAITKGKFQGLQQGAYSYVADGVGVQWGIVNHAKHMNGLMFGLVNWAESMEGIQIGLINVIKSGGQFPVFPIVNWSF
jgi:hypothetical protein